MTFRESAIPLLIIPLPFLPIKTRQFSTVARQFQTAISHDVNTRACTCHVSPHSSARAAVYLPPLPKIDVQLTRCTKNVAYRCSLVMLFSSSHYDSVCRAAKTVDILLIITQFKQTMGKPLMISAGKRHSLHRAKGRLAEGRDAGDGTKDNYLLLITAFNRISG